MNDIILLGVEFRLVPILQTSHTKKNSYEQDPILDQQRIAYVAQNGMNMDQWEQFFGPVRHKKEYQFTGSSSP